MAGFRQDIAEGKLSPNHELYLELMKIDKEDNYVGCGESVLLRCIHVLKNSGGTGFNTVLSMTENLGTTLKHDEQQPAEVSTATQNGVFLSGRSTVATSSTKSSTNATVTLAL